MLKFGGLLMHQLINKAAITVIPKEPFIKWVQSTDAEAAEISDESILSYSRVYLVDDSLNGDDPEKLIKRNFKVIFEEELAGWYTDEEAWPKKMDLRLFKQWFHVKVHEVVVDIGKKQPIAEEY